MSALDLGRLETLDVSPEEFDHAAHVKMAWLYLREAPAETAEARFIATLRRITRHFGMPERYHETITRAFWLLIAERHRRDPDAGWSAFAARLLQPRTPGLRRSAAAFPPPGTARPRRPQRRHRVNRP